MGCRNAVVRLEQQLLKQLTPREVQLLQRIAEGYRLREVAQFMHISLKTADCMRSRVMDKLDIHDRVRLTRFAIRHGVASPHDEPARCG